MDMRLKVLEHLSLVEVAQIAALNKEMLKDLAAHEEAWQTRLVNGVEATFGVHIIDEMAEILAFPFDHPDVKYGRQGWTMLRGGLIVEGPRPCDDTYIKVWYEEPKKKGRKMCCWVSVYVSRSPVGIVKFSSHTGVRCVNRRIAINVMKKSPLLGLLLRAAWQRPCRFGRVKCLQVFRRTDARTSEPLSSALLHDVPPASRRKGEVFPSVQQLDDTAAGVMDLGALLGSYDIQVSMGDIQLEVECIPN